MDYSQKWRILGNLGEGGQGKVYRVCKEKEYSNNHDKLTASLRTITGGVVYASMGKDAYDTLCEELPKMLQLTDPVNQYALKVLHKPPNARDPKLANERIKHEIGAMSKNLHPNLIKLEDFDPEGKWFVSRFYSGGMLTQKLDKYKGDFLSVLKAVRPIVEGVAKLHAHEPKFVHRDIKPENIFIGAKDDLVLGDFGLVFFDDPQHTRISETYQNVGSHDWMPGWAIGMRIEEVKPTFDVFSLGKVIWSMISGKRILRLWYFRDEEFDVEKMFPNSLGLNFANQLFDKCIVERERNCLPDAGALLQEIDKTINLIECGADSIDLIGKRKCKVCGMGEYDMVAGGDSSELHNFGFSPPAGNRTMKIYICSNCGNVQLFSCDRDTPPPAWHKLKNDA